MLFRQPRSYNSPMERRAHLSLTQLIAAYIGGSLLAASSFYAIDLADLGHNHGTPGFWLRIFLSLSPMALGLYINFAAHQTIEAGIAAERWPEDKILTLRASFETVLWRGFNVTLMLAAIAIMCADDRHLRSTSWFLLTLAQCLLRIQYAFKTPKSESPPSIDWRNHQPLQSSHWGNH